MELLDGETMANAIARGPMARALVATLVEQLGEALDQAHEHGVVHRDIKLSNLFLTVDRKDRHRSGNHGLHCPRTAGTPVP